MRGQCSVVAEGGGVRKHEDRVPLRFVRIWSVSAILAGTGPPARGPVPLHHRPACGAGRVRAPPAGRGVCPGAIAGPGRARGVGPW